MSWFPRPSSPRAVYRDFIGFVRQREREHVIGAALAFLVTLVIVVIFVLDSRFGVAPPPQVVEVELYPSNRTDAQIIADQKKEMAEKAAGEREKRRQFQRLAKELGM